MEIWSFVAVALFASALSGAIGFVVGRSLGMIDGKYDERIRVAKWAADNGHHEVMWHLTYNSIKEAL